jgi:POT family proton-dependent oligopeptide transporter
MGTRLGAVERRHVFVIMLLCLCVVLFTSGLEQAGSTMNLFARDFTDRSFLGNMFNAGEHPATWYQSIGPCFVLILSPMFAAMWVALGARGLNPSTPMKFGAGLVLLGLSFAVMAFAVSSTVMLGLKAVPAWLVTVYFIQVVAELCLSPIGLSAVTKLSPRARGGQMMGMWFLASAAGSLIAGVLGGWVGSASIDEMPRHFLIMAACGVLAGLAMALAASPLNRLTRPD